jgi:iron complex transport system permease protein
MVQLAIPARAGLAEGDRTWLGSLAVWAIGGLLVLAALLSLLTGASDASLPRLIMAYLAGGPLDALAARDQLIFLDIRLPRVFLGILVGGGLAVSGVVMQGLFRNPLADPGLVGVSSGASLGAVLVIVLGGTVLTPVFAFTGIYTLQFAAFFGGLLTTIILYRVATAGGQTQIATMLLAGIAIGALAGAVMGVMIYISSDAQLRDFTFWSMGSLAGANWQKVLASAPIILTAIIGCLFLAPGLNALTMGEAAAAHMGVPVERLKKISIVAVAAATGAAVAVSGGIGFIGIVVPHLLRLIIGPDHKYLIPASALLGGAFLLFADAIARTIVAPAELPIGIVTATVGGPFFLWILLSRRGALAW